MNFPYCDGRRLAYVTSITPWEAGYDRDVTEPLSQTGFNKVNILLRIDKGSPGGALHYCTHIHK